MRTSFIYVLLVLLVLGGCSTVHTPRPTVLSERHRAQLGNVVVEGHYRTGENIGGITTGKGSGAASGMGRAVGGLMDGAAGSSDPGAGLVVVLALPFAALGGAIYGSAVADSSADVKQQLDVMRVVLDAAPQTYEQQVQANFTSLPFVRVAAQGDEAGAPGSRLAVRFHELRTVGGGPKSEIRFVLVTRTQLFAGADPYPMFAREYVVGSRTMRLSKWVADDGASLQLALDKLAADTVKDIMDDHFLSSPYRVEAVYPARNYAFRPQRLDTTTPTLRWALKEGALSVSEGAHEGLEYDLMLVQRKGDTFNMNGIEQSRFQVTDALPTCARYKWQVRANYTSIGQARTTPWSPAREFRTPCPGK